MKVEMEQYRTISIQPETETVNNCIQIQSKILL
jgi:hypothetical protein